MSRYKTKDYSNRREYLDWLAERYGVDRADVVLLASILGTDQDFDGLPSTLADLPAAKHTQGAVFPTDRPKRAKLPSNLGKFSIKRHDIKEENDYGRPQEKPFDRSVPRPGPRRAAGHTRASRGGKTACRWSRQAYRREERTGGPQGPCGHYSQAH